ncbi:hypothetical protein V6N11_050661 [Hibiscus sabdariffa]|uniref:Uncharacterized protein n=1 Tax=Hibiscus sabdariffa TaxID=183260 RepID=A0ABR2TAN1_9ROSI
MKSAVVDPLLAILYVLVVLQQSNRTGCIWCLPWPTLFVSILWQLWKIIRFMASTIHPLSLMLYTRSLRKKAGYV